MLDVDEKTKENIYHEAIAVWSPKSQLLQTCEECAELICAIHKFLRGRITDENVLEEIADVEVMIEQCRLMFDSQKIDTIKNMKIKRLKKRLDGI